MANPFKNRPQELKSHIVIFLTLTLQYVPSFSIVSSSLHKVWIVLYFIGYHTEGLRSSQTICGVLYLLMSLCAMFWPDPLHPVRLATSALAAVAWTQHMYFAWKLGAADYSKLEIKGPDKAGVRYLRTEKMGIELAVFYPVLDDEAFRAKVRDGGAPLHKDEAKAIEVLKNLMG